MRLLAFIALLSILSCLGRTGPEGCSTFSPPVPPVSSESFNLSAKGDSHSCGDWTISVEPDVLLFDAKLTCENRQGSKLGYWNAHEQIAPIRLVARLPIQYVANKRIRATLRHDTVAVHAQTVMQSQMLFAEPDFSQAPTARQKSFWVAPQLDASPDSNWLYTLADDNEQNKQCLAQSLAELAKILGDKVGIFVDDPCKACQSITSALAQVEDCKTLVNNLSTTMCDAFLAEAAKESWSSTILNYGCKGATWLGLWVANYKIEAGVTDNICANTSIAEFEKFVQQYKTESSCMCGLFIRDPRCKAAPDAQCEQIWNDVIGAK